MGLWAEVHGRRPRSVAVFGLAKNAGKTVALNRLVAGAGNAGMTLGLTSIGRDGETWDVVTHRRKPAIHAAQGTLLATAESCLNVGSARLEVLERTGIGTPLGPVIVARVLSAGTVEVAGPGRAGSLRGMVLRLLELGAELVLVDGAIDRQSPASPRVTEACVLATGAVLSQDMARVVEMTRERVRQLTLPAAAQVLRRAWCSGRVMVTAGGDTLGEFDGTTLLKGGVSLKGLIRDRDASVLVGGALTDPLLHDLLGTRVSVVIRDATRLFVEGELLSRFERHGGRVQVVEPIDLAAVTVNPFSPEGWAFDPWSFFEAVRGAIPDVPVFDVVAGYPPA